MSGWGKRFAMDLLAKLIVVARKKANDSNLSDDDDLCGDDLDGDHLESKNCVALMLDEFDAKKDFKKDSGSLQCYVPLAITLNSLMTLGPKPDDKDSKTWISSEIAKRLIYAYFAYLTNVSYSLSEDTVKRENGSLWLCNPVLECLYDLTSTIIDELILLLLIDEPDKVKGALNLVRALVSNALLSSWETSSRKKLIVCHVVTSALEQHFCSSADITTRHSIREDNFWSTCKGAMS